MRSVLFRSARPPGNRTLDDEHSKLTVLRFGEDTYLMVETGGKAVPSGKGLIQNSVWLRFNVKSVEDAAAEIFKRQSVCVEWGDSRGWIALMLPMIRRTEKPGQAPGS